MVDLDALKRRLSLHSRRLLNYIPVCFFLFFLAFGEFSMSSVLRRIALETIDGVMIVSGVSELWVGSSLMEPQPQPG